MNLAKLLQCLEDPACKVGVADGIDNPGHTLAVFVLLEEPHRPGTDCYEEVISPEEALDAAARLQECWPARAAELREVVAEVERLLAEPCPEEHKPLKRMPPNLEDSVAQIT
jgi:hypothetical protein